MKNFTIQDLTENYVFNPIKRKLENLGFNEYFQQEYEKNIRSIPLFGKMIPEKTPTESIKTALQTDSREELEKGIVGMADFTSGLKKVGGKVIQNVAQGTFKGFKDLTTKFLDYAKGKTTLSRQEIIDFARRPELKKGEADLINRLGSEVKEGKIPAQEFADSMRRELLELKPVKVKEPQYQMTTIRQVEPGNIRSSTYGGKNYEEVVFESPIKTEGSSHYPNSKNYFAHARGDEVAEGEKKIWREQEIQSDLLQKDNINTVRQMNDEQYQVAWEKAQNELFPGASETEISKSSEMQRKIGERVQLYAELPKEKLMPFINDRFGERIMRERIREKAQKGYSKYRIPTGETIGKIEGFEEGNWTTQTGEKVIPENVNVGDTIMLGGNDPYIITKKFPNGQIKAINSINFSMIDEMSAKGDFSHLVGDDRAMIKGIKSDIDIYSETFDLTGKSNPQYRRYQDWGKFLKNKYGGKEITDPQGNTWVEIDLKPEYKKSPIEAFGIGVGLTAEEIKQRIEEKNKPKSLKDNITDLLRKYLKK